MSPLDHKFNLIGMTHHLEQISAKTKTGRHAVVMMDGAGWHQALWVEDISNVGILTLPRIHRS